jgi:L-ascorbate 6-phosphate lactonase
LKSILDTPLDKHQAGLWFLGQAGNIFRSQTLCISIGPYLSDSVNRVAPAFRRLYPPPLDPAALRVGIYVVTYDHLNHLDPETNAYGYKENTLFVAPPLVYRKQATLGIPPVNFIRIDSGETLNLLGAPIMRLYTLPFEVDMIDTTGYRIQFDNRRSIYHTSDMVFSELLFKCSPQTEVALACINRKDGNMGAQVAVRVAKAVALRVAATPNHFDLMALYAEIPQAFAYVAMQECPESRSKFWNCWNR